LLQHAALHHGNPRRERHCLDLVVRYIDDGGAESLMQLFDFGAHVQTQLRIQVGQGLIEQVKLGLARQRPPDGNALALASGKLARLAIEQVFDLQQRGTLFTRSARLLFSTLRMASGNSMFLATVMFGYSA
jgi:hypothetical protein